MTTPVTIPDALVAAITAAVAPAAAYDGMVPDEPADRYVVVYADPGTLTAVAACGRSDSVTHRWQVTSVAPTREQAAWLATRVRDTTVDTVPVVAGWSCGQIRHTYAQLPQRDETVLERSVSYQVDLYELLATKT